jgi:SAM-dependent methyltransferase
VEHLLRATARAEERHFWFRGFRYFVEPLVREALQKPPHNPPLVLDCGCGTGANVEWLANCGRTFGFDLSEIGPRIGREHGRTNLARASADAVPFPSNMFDLVTSFDVLYSLPSGVESRAVAEMHRVTRPGGFAIVNVAAMELLKGDHSVLSQELRRYSRDSLRQLMTTAGFSIVRLTYTNASLFLPLLAVRTFHRVRGLSSEADASAEITVPSMPVNAALTAALWLESQWLRVVDNPFGSSLLCLARKGS